MILKCNAAVNSHHLVLVATHRLTESSIILKDLEQTIRNGSEKWMNAAARGTRKERQYRGTDCAAGWKHSADHGEILSIYRIYIINLAEPSGI